MTHPCPIEGCSIAVPPDVFMCARHWRMVPRPLRDAIYEDYGRVGSRGENHREAVRVVTAAEGARSRIALPPGTKALTIWQPWASLVILRAKPYEFRRWNFADKPHLARLIGRRIVIHAGARPPRLSEIDDVLERIAEGESALDDKIALPFLTRLRSRVETRDRDGAGRLALLAAALGTAILGEPRNVVDLFNDQVADSDRLDQHMYGWPLSDVQQFAEPIPAAGAQGFWNWS